MSSRKDFVPYEGIVQRGAQELSRLYKTESKATVRKLAESAVGKTAKAKAGRIIESLTDVFRSLYSESNMPKSMLPLMKKSALMGANSFNDSGLLTRSVQEYQTVTAGFEEHVRYFADNYVGRIVVPRLRKTLADSTPDELATELTREATRLFENNEAYWHNVVHQAASNSYHYGMLKAADNAGHRSLMYIAVRDDRTTDFCLSIDGQTVALAPVLKQAIEVSDITGPAIKKYEPWTIIKTMRKPTAKTMLRKKVLLPPFHANCRTTVHIY